MIRLDATTKILQLIATDTANVIVSGVVESTFAGFSEETAATASTQTVCSAPSSAAAIKDIDHISIKNTGASNTVTVQVYNSSGTVTTEQVKAILAADQTLEYTHAGGWKVVNVDVVLPGTDITYVESSTAVNVTSTNPAAGTAVISTSATTYDGTDVYVQFFAPTIQKGTTYMVLLLCDGATVLWQINQTVLASEGGWGMRKITPSAGSHTYNVKGYVDGGTGVVTANAGSGDQKPPMFLRVIKA